MKAGILIDRCLSFPARISGVLAITQASWDDCLEETHGFRWLFKRTARVAVVQHHGSTHTGDTQRETVAQDPRLATAIPSPSTPTSIDK
jgi:hypothetical protein